MSIFRFLFAVSTIFLLSSCGEKQPGNQERGQQYPAPEKTIVTIIAPGQETPMERSGPPTSQEWFDDESYLKTLATLNTYSIYTAGYESDDDSLGVYENQIIRDLHKKVVHSFFKHDDGDETYKENLLWFNKDFPFQLLDRPEVQKLFKSINFDDNDFISDFDPLIRMIQCINNSTELDKIGNCLLSNDDLSTNYFLLSEIYYALIVETIWRMDPRGKLLSQKAYWKYLQNDSSASPKDYISQPSLLKGDIAYITLTSFNTEGTAEYLESLLRMETGPKSKGLILDLRGNEGGLKTEFWKLSDLFLAPEHLISVSVDRSPVGTWNEPECRYTGSFDSLYTKPVILLVDRNTASAAESFISAMKANNRVLVIGEPTYGKSIRQSFFDLPRPDFLSEGVMYFSTANNYDPITGATWYGKGISPDITVENIAEGRRFAEDSENRYLPLPPKLVENVDTSKCRSKAVSPSANDWETLLTNGSLRQAIVEEGLNIFPTDKVLGVAIRAFELL